MAMMASRLKQENKFSFSGTDQLLYQRVNNIFVISRLISVSSVMWLLIIYRLSIKRATLFSISTLTFIRWFVYFCIIENKNEYSTTRYNLLTKRLSDLRTS